MEPETLVRLGIFCESVLRDDNFNAVCLEFEKSTSQQMLSTKPSQSEVREEIFATFHGATTFIAFMQSFVTEKNRLLNAELSEPDDEIL